MEPRSGPVVLSCAVCATAGFLAATLAGFDPPAVLLLVVAAISYGCGRYAGLPAGPVAMIALFVAMASRGDSVVPFAIVTVVPFIVGRVLKSRADLVSTLELRERELLAEQDALARLSVSHERARIAAELHDIVAHHLAVIVIQAGAGRVAADGGDADAERFTRIRQSGDEALEEMSHLVDLLRPSENGGGGGRERRIEVLVDQAQAAGLSLDTEGLPPERALAPEVEQLAYRVVQEGLTNAMKHAPGSDVSLRLAVGRDAVEIDVSNDGGKGATSLAATGSGIGLVGLRSRLESLGGKLDAGPSQPDGWRLHARVPIS